MPIKWSGSTVCDICGITIQDVLYDSITKYGCWATLCQKCFNKHTHKVIGIGNAQKYVRQNKTNIFIKVEG